MKFPAIEFVDDCDHDHALPDPVILSSALSNWKGLQFNYTRQQAFYIPEHTSPYHILCVNTGDPITLERAVDGQTETIDALPTGDFGLYPANLRQSFQWHQEAEAIHLFLDPNLLYRTATELCLQDGIVLVGHGVSEDTISGGKSFTFICPLKRLSHRPVEIIDECQNPFF